jgi:hypothetical protein
MKKLQTGQENLLRTEKKGSTPAFTGDFFLATNRNSTVFHSRLIKRRVPQATARAREIQNAQPTPER